MRFPSKFSEFDESILAKISYLLDEDVEEIDIKELINKNYRKFNDISEFIAALDILYALEKIELDSENGIIKYVN